MKSGIHPDYHSVVVKTFNKDGSEKVFESRSTTKENNLVGEINIFEHPAWKDNSCIDAKNSVNAIMRKFVTKFYGTKE